MKWLFLLMLSTQAVGQVLVKPYVRSDGTYVAPHIRTMPNNTTVDNYSNDSVTTPPIRMPETHRMENLLDNAINGVAE